MTWVHTRAQVSAAEIFSTVGMKCDILVSRSVTTRMLSQWRLVGNLTIKSRDMPDQGHSGLGNGSR